MILFAAPMIRLRQAVRQVRRVPYGITSSEDAAAERKLFAAVWNGPRADCQQACAVAAVHFRASITPSIAVVLKLEPGTAFGG